MGDWYEVGITLGLGLAAGVLLVGLLAGTRYGLAGSLIGAVAIGLVAGLLVRGWIGVGGGVVGGLVGAVSAWLIVRGALSSGGTRGGTAVLVAGAAVAIACLSLIPAVGYVLAVMLPAVALRRARQEPERYAGLRTLSK